MNTNKQMTYYNLKGEETNNPDNFSSRKGEGRWSIPIHLSIAYDPHGIYSNRSTTVVNRVKLKSVAKQVFDNYIEYLKTRNRSYYLATNRGILND